MDQPKQSVVRVRELSMRSVRFAVLFLFALPFTGVSVFRSCAQSLTTASKGAEISAYGGYVASSPDYGLFIKKGIGAGVDFTIFPRLPVAPSLEIRGHEAFGGTVTEKALMAGLRVQKDLRQRYHPYADFLIGTGEIVYQVDPYPQYNSDRSKAYSYGGGINIDVAKHFAAKFDFQEQSWNLGSNGNLKPSGGNYTLSPRTFLVGATYTIPFRKLNSRRDFH